MLVLGACGDSNDDDSAGRSSPPAEAVTIVDFEYDPAELTAAPGGEIVYTNDDGTAHTATSSDGGFDSGSIEGGGTGTVTAPDQPGEYPYVCSFHPFMKGVVVVE